MKHPKSQLYHTSEEKSSTFTDFTKNSRKIPVKLFNTLTRKLEPFTPLDPQNLKIYTCGPTVYNYQHIGNYAAYVYWDLLVRTLAAHHYQVNRVLNLTDVGHLASDADDGEDKLEKGARRENKTVWQVAEFYADDFLQNYQALHLTPPQKIAKATDYIQENIDLVDILLAKGFAYQVTDGIYYDTAKFPTYPDFAKLDLENLKAGARVSFNAEKRNPADFALWKFIQPNENHAMRWDYLGRPGYPGWHIECASIIHKELGEPIDIHTGGVDHIPVHHTNEIAQSEAAYDTKLANFWLHCNFITVEGQKMAKSLGNVYTLQDLATQSFAPLDFKMWVLEGHYQTLRNFTFQELSAARSRRLNWRNRIAKLHQLPLNTINSDFSTQLLTHLSNNLSSPAALALIDATEHLSLSDWQSIDQLLGLNLIGSTPDLSPETKALIQKRQLAREQKDYQTSDQLRDQLLTQNITILDTDSGPIWQYLT